MPPPKGQGHPAKWARKLVGLRNQQKPSEPAAVPAEPVRLFPAPGNIDDVMKPNLRKEEERGSSSGESEQTDWEDADDDGVAGIANALVKKAKEEVIDGDDPVGDPNWIPEALQHRRANNLGSELKSVC